jgi:hypothetical protein
MYCSRSSERSTDGLGEGSVFYKIRCRKRAQYSGPYADRPTAGLYEVESALMNVWIYD